MITATNETKGGNFTPVPAGTHVATCYQMIELGTITTEFNGETKHQKKVRITWELPNETKTIEGKEKPMVISKDFTLSMHEKATLRKFLESWRGKAFSDEEAKKFDVTNLLGKPCMISVVHVDKDGKSFANITSVSALPKGFAAPVQFNESFVLSYDAFDFQKFESLPQFIKDKMKETPEFKGLMNAENEAIETNDEPLPF